MEHNDTDIEFIQERLRLSARYNFIIFPIDYSVLRRVLTAQQYKVAPPPSPDMPQIGGILDVDGLIARKEGITVDSQADRQVIGMNSKSVEELLPAFDELENSLSQEIGQDLTTKSLFYEIIIQLALKTDKSPLGVMSKLAKNYPQCNAMSKILGEKVAPFSFRFSPANMPVESENWFDFTIEPLISKATNTYYVSFVLRNKNRNEVINHLKNYKKTISDALQLLESS